MWFRINQAAGWISVLDGKCNSCALMQNENFFLIMNQPQRLLKIKDIKINVSFSFFFFFGGGRRRQGYVDYCVINYILKSG